MGYAWMKTLIPFLFFMISKVRVVFGCKIPLIFFEYNSFSVEEIKMKYIYYYFGQVFLLQEREKPCIFLL